MESHYIEIPHHHHDFEHDGGAEPHRARVRRDASRRGPEERSLVLAKIFMAVLLGAVLWQGHRVHRRGGSTSELLATSSSSQNIRRVALSRARRNKGGPGIGGSILDVTERKMADLVRRIEALGLRAVDETEEFIGGSGGREVTNTANKVQVAYPRAGTRAASPRRSRNVSSSQISRHDYQPQVNRTLRVKLKTPSTKLYRAKRGTFDARTGAGLFLKPCPLK
jgi:hypothetical protein